MPSNWFLLLDIININGIPQYPHVAGSHEARCYNHKERDILDERKIKVD